MKIAIGAAVPVILLLLTITYFWRLTVQGEALFWGMPLLQFFPWRTFAVEEYLAGRVPLWNPYAGMGAPLAANLQSGVFYPLNFFYLALPIEKAMTVTVVLHVFLAGWFTYLFLRRLGLPLGAALVSGCAFMFSGFLIAQAGFHNVISAVAWVPGVFLAIEGWLGAGSRRWAAAIVTSVAMALTAGFIQSAAYGLILAAAYLVVRTMASVPLPQFAAHVSRNPPSRFIADAQIRDLQRHHARKQAAQAFLFTLAKGSLLFLLGTAAAAIQLLPTWELTWQSVRRTGLDYTDATGYSLFPGQLITAVAPTFFGSQPGGDWWGPGAPWEGVIYLGVLPLLLALYGLVHGRGGAAVPPGTPPTAWVGDAPFSGSLGTSSGPHPNPLPEGEGISESITGGTPLSRAVPLFFGVSALAGLVLATGRYNPLFPWLFDHVPGVQLFHAPARLVLWYVFPMAVLSGFGWAALLGGPPGAGRRLGAWASAGGMGVLLILLATGSFLPGIPRAETAFPALGWAAGWLLAAGLLVVARARWPCRPSSSLRASPWTIAAAALVFADLFLYGKDLNPGTDARLYAPSRLSSVDAVQNEAGMGRTFVTDTAYASVVHRLFNSSRFPPGGWEQLWEMRALLTPNLGTVEDLFEVHNYDPLRVHRTERLRLLAEAARLPAPLLDLMGVKFLVKPESAADGRLEPPIGAAFYRRPDPLPRAYILNRAVAVPDSDAAFAFIANPRFDPRQEAAVETGEPGQVYTFPTAPRPASIVDYGTQRLRVETDGGGGFLLLTDTYYPGWKALVDGVERTIFAANGAFRGVFLNPGDMVVEFVYDPSSFKIGALLSALGLLATGVLAAGAPPWSLLVRSAAWSRRTLEDRHLARSAPANHRQPEAGLEEVAQAPAMAPAGDGTTPDEECEPRPPSP